MATINDLWGAQLTAVDFDPVVHTMSMRFEANDGGGRVIYTASCQAVNGISFHNSIALPWNYADVAAAYLEPDTTAGGVIFTLELWDEDCELIVRCQSVDINPR